MTLQQLRYVTTIAETGTLSEAARRFYIAQPSLTASLRELEEELGLTIFRRTNRGAVLTPEGEEFLGYARQVLAQMDLMEEKYLGAAPVKHQFCVSTQHYSFAVEAFVELLREYGGPEYDFRIRETQTYELIEDVALLRSEVGVLYLNKDNETRSSGSMTCSLRRCLRPSRMYLSARPARWRPSPPSRWTTWPHTRAFPMSRASTTPFIFPKKF